MARRDAMKPVFLSASIPDPRRDPRYIETADVTAIRESIRALAEVVLLHGHLVFGGHPAISPLVRVIAESIGEIEYGPALQHVRVYQSEFFREDIPQDSIAFPDLIWIPAAEDREGSLYRMRTAMIESNPFEAGFFIGGMEGVEEEYEMFSRRWPLTPVFPVASTGAAARILFDRRADQLGGTAALLLEDLVYGSLFERLLGL